MRRRRFFPTLATILVIVVCVLLVTATRPPWRAPPSLSVSTCFASACIF